MKRSNTKMLIMHELTLLSMHIKHNLWIGSEYDFVMLDDDIGVHLDAAMMVRREGLPGARTPDGILTRLSSTHVGRIISEIESRPDPSTIELGLQLLALGENSTDTINEGIGLISTQAASDGKNHDFTGWFGDSSSGLTIHCNDRSRDTAVESLFYHCSLRKYSHKASRWFGLVISPGRADVRFGLTLEGEWKQNRLMDEAVQRMPVGIPPKKVKAALKTEKIGRNDPCPCGGGRKYKKCCGG